MFTKNDPVVSSFYWISEGIYALQQIIHIKTETRKKQAHFTTYNRHIYLIT